MKKNKTILIGGEQFTIKETIPKDELFYKNNGYYNIYDCYDKPSTSKVYIYNKYYNLLNDNCEDVKNYGVRTYNTFMITLRAYTTINNQKYYCVITPSYNTLYKIEGDV